MANEHEHVLAANRTHETIGVLLREKEVTSPWIATAAFYKALQVVEAVFANDRAVQHTSDHGRRGSYLKSTRKYQHICEHYFPLERASIVARYLSDCTCFDTYLSPDDVEREILKHRLHQVETSARKFLTNESLLKPINELFSDPRVENRLGAANEL